MSQEKSTDSFLTFELKAKLKALGASVEDNQQPFAPHAIFQNPVVKRTSGSPAGLLAKRQESGARHLRTTSAVLRDLKRGEASSSNSSQARSSSVLPPLKEQYPNGSQATGTSRPNSSLSFFAPSQTAEPSDILRQLRAKKALEEAKNEIETELQQRKKQEKLKVGYVPFSEPRLVRNRKPEQETQNKTQRHIGMKRNNPNPRKAVQRSSPVATVATADPDLESPRKVQQRLLEIKEFEEESDSEDEERILQKLRIKEKLRDSSLDDSVSISSSRVAEELLREELSTNSSSGAAKSRKHRPPTWNQKAKIQQQKAKRKEMQVKARLADQEVKVAEKKEFMNRYMRFSEDAELMDLPSFVNLQDSNPTSRRNSGTQLQPPTLEGKPPPPEELPSPIAVTRKATAKPMVEGDPPGTRPMDNIFEDSLLTNSLENSAANTPVHKSSLSSPTTKISPEGLKKALVEDLRNRRGTQAFGEGLLSHETTPRRESDTSPGIVDSSDPLDSGIAPSVTSSTRSSIVMMNPKDIINRKLSSTSDPSSSASDPTQGRKQSLNILSTPKSTIPVSELGDERKAGPVLPPKLSIPRTSIIHTGQTAPQQTNDPVVELNTSSRKSENTAWEQQQEEQRLEMLKKEAKAARGKAQLLDFDVTKRMPETAEYMRLIRTPLIDERLRKAKESKREEALLKLQTFSREDTVDGPLDGTVSSQSHLPGKTLVALSSTTSSLHQPSQRSSSIEDEQNTSASSAFVLPNRLIRFNTTAASAGRGSNSGTVRKIRNGAASNLGGNSILSEADNRVFALEYELRHFVRRLTEDHIRTLAAPFASALSKIEFGDRGDSRSVGLYCEEELTGLKAVSKILSKVRRGESQELSEVFLVPRINPNENGMKQESIRDYDLLQTKGDLSTTLPELSDDQIQNALSRRKSKGKGTGSFSLLNIATGEDLDLANSGRMSSKGGESLPLTIKSSSSRSTAPLGDAFLAEGDNPLSNQITPKHNNPRELLNVSLGSKPGGLSSLLSPLAPTLADGDRKVAMDHMLMTPGTGSFGVANTPSGSLGASSNSKSLRQQMLKVASHGGRTPLVNQSILSSSMTPASRSINSEQATLLTPSAGGQGLNTHRSMVSSIGEKNVLSDLDSANHGLQLENNNLTSPVQRKGVRFDVGSPDQGSRTPPTRSVEEMEQEALDQFVELHTPKDRIAIVISVSKFESPYIKDLPVADEDATNLVLTLSSLGWSCIPMTTTRSPGLTDHQAALFLPTLTNIKRVLSAFMKSVPGPLATVGIFIISRGFSGRIEGLDGAWEAALLPDTDPADICEENVFLPAQFASMKDASGKHPFLFVDTWPCPYLPAYVSKQPSVTLPFCWLTSMVEDGGNEMIATYGKDNGGLGTYYLLKGLEGRALQPTSQATASSVELSVNALIWFLANKLGVKRGLKVQHNAVVPKPFSVFFPMFHMPAPPAQLREMLNQHRVEDSNTPCRVNVRFAIKIPGNGMGEVKGPTWAKDREQWLNSITKTLMKMLRPSTGKGNGAGGSQKKSVFGGGQKQAPTSTELGGSGIVKGKVPSLPFIRSYAIQDFHHLCVEYKDSADLITSSERRGFVKRDFKRISDRCERVRDNLPPMVALENKDATASKPHESPRKVLQMTAAIIANALSTSPQQSPRTSALRQPSAGSPNASPSTSPRIVSFAATKKLSFDPEAPPTQRSSESTTLLNKSASLRYMTSHEPKVNVLNDHERRPHMNEDSFRSRDSSGGSSLPLPADPPLAARPNLNISGAETVLSQFASGEVTSPVLPGSDSATQGSASGGFLVFDRTKEKATTMSGNDFSSVRSSSISSSQGPVSRSRATSLGARLSNASSRNQDSDGGPRSLTSPEDDDDSLFKVHGFGSNYRRPKKRQSSMLVAHPSSLPPVNPLKLENVEDDLLAQVSDGTLLSRYGDDFVSLAPCFSDGMLQVDINHPMPRDQWNFLIYYFAAAFSRSTPKGEVPVVLSRKPVRLYTVVDVSFTCTIRDFKKLRRMMRQQLFSNTCNILSVERDPFATVHHLGVAKIQALLRGHIVRHVVWSQQATLQEEKHERQQIANLEHSKWQAFTVLLYETLLIEFQRWESFFRLEIEQSQSFDYMQNTNKALKFLQRREDILRAEYEWDEKVNWFPLQEIGRRLNYISKHTMIHTGILNQHYFLVGTMWDRFYVELSAYQGFLQLRNELRDKHKGMQFKMSGVMDPPKPPCADLSKGRSIIRGIEAQDKAGKFDNIDPSPDEVMNLSRTNSFFPEMLPTPKKRAVTFQTAGGMDSSVRQEGMEASMVGFWAQRK